MYSRAWSLLRWSHRFSCLQFPATTSKDLYLTSRNRMLARKVTTYNDPLDHEIALRYITCFRNERNAGIIRNDLKTARTPLQKKRRIWRIAVSSRCKTREKSADRCRHREVEINLTLPHPILDTASVERAIALMRERNSSSWRLEISGSSKSYRFSVLGGKGFNRSSWSRARAKLRRSFGHIPNPRLFHGSWRFSLVAGQSMFVCSSYMPRGNIDRHARASGA